MGIMKRLWNVFTNRDPTINYPDVRGSMYGSRPDLVTLTGNNHRSIVAAVYNRIAVDCAAIDLKHVRLDDTGNYSDTIDDALNQILSVEANCDQTGRQLILDAVLSMLDEGNVAIVPIDSDRDPEDGSYILESVRVAKIVQWAPRHIQVHAYNDRTGLYEYLWFEKANCVILENPFYTVMNASGATAQRLISKLNLLDIMDESKRTTKLDLIIGLPYVIKTPNKKAQADKRRQEIIDQLTTSEYGIAYTDGSEKITQLNRAVESNLMPQVEYYTRMLYSQLGFTEAVLDGTASPEVMNNYANNVLEPILTRIIEEIRRKWLTKTARSQKQSIMYFRNPFKLIPVDKLPDMADKFTRNEILTTNEFRPLIGIIPSKDPKADELRNKNLSPAKTEETVNINETINKEENQNEET